MGMMLILREHAMLVTPATSSQLTQMDGPRLKLKIKWPTCTMGIPTVSCTGLSQFISFKTLEEVPLVQELHVVLSGQVSKMSNIYPVKAFISSYLGYTYIILI